MNIDIKDKIILKFLKHCKKKGSEYVDKNYRAISQVLYLLDQTNFIDRILRIRQELGVDEDRFKLGKKLDESEQIHYDKKLIYHGTEPNPYIIEQFKLFCNQYSINYDLNKVFMDYFICSNGDARLSYSGSNFHKKLPTAFGNYKSDENKAILHLPNEQSKSFKIEFFSNTSKTNLENFIEEIWKYVKKYNSDWTNEIDIYQWKKTTKTLYENVLLRIADYEKKINPFIENNVDNSQERRTDAYLIDEVFGDQDFLPVKKELKQKNKIRQRRKRIKDRLLKTSK